MGIKEVTFSPVVSPICLPQIQSLDPALYDGKGATVIGWGSIKKASANSGRDGVLVNRLARATLIIYDNR